MRQNQGFRRDICFAERIWGELKKPLKESLLELLRRHRLSVAAGDLLLIDGKWYVTHSGLLGIALRKRCKGMRITPVKELTDQATSHFAFRTTVFTSPTSEGFDGYGDADPSNVSTLVQGAEMRVAEIGAVNQALRKAYGIARSGSEFALQQQRHLMSQGVSLPVNSHSIVFPDFLASRRSTAAPISLLPAQPALAFERDSRSTGQHAGEI